MAQFKIYLLNLRANESEFTPRYSAIPISEFNNTYTQNDKRYTATISQNNYSNFCYTYDEQFSLGQNAQKTLSFSMNKNVIRVDRVELNPFINYLFIGTQVLLVDKYDNHHLMTISKISYDFKELNTVFKYECQDSFNYQLSRQNDGYEIENNTEDVDFIGAQQLDWWVLCKIHPECKISYNYLKLSDSLVENNNIKPVYSKEQYKDFYKTVPFSASGTANSVLIALGELYGMQLNVYERVDFKTGLIKKYYWFETTKSLKPTGLKYSPELDLQSFGLQHDSGSFSSILNIQSHNVGDELITAIPSVPNFFRQWFESDDWRKSKFIPGLFSAACQQTVTIIQESKSNLSIYTKDDQRYIKIPLQIKLKSHYDLFKFTSGDNNYSTVTLVGRDGTLNYSSKYSAWNILVGDKVLTEAHDILTSDFIDEINENNGFDLILPIGEEDISSANLKLYFCQYRQPTTEELEFAYIADQLPWLENKLIDFKYFYNHSIINKSEYDVLMKILENDLREVNSKLLLYSQLYYQELQNKTKIIAGLSSKIDMVGAIFQADLINPFQLDGRTSSTKKFETALSDLFTNTEEPTKLITYYETLTDYVNKYIGAEQTFLKNMYLFKEYFNSKTDFNVLYTYNFTFINKEKGEIALSFSSLNDYVLLTNKNINNVTPLYKKEDGIYVPFAEPVVDKDNYKQYYYIDSTSNKVEITLENLEKYEGYSKDQTYYEKQWLCSYTSDLEPLFNKLKTSHEKYIIGIDNSVGVEEYAISLSGDKLLITCHMHVPHQNMNKGVISFDYGGETYNVEAFEVIYEPISFAAMRNAYFIRSAKNDTILKKQYLHRQLTDAESNMIQVKFNSSSWAEDIQSTGMNPSVLFMLEDSKNWSKDERKEFEETPDNAYKKYLPLSTYYWWGKKSEKDENTYHATYFVNGENYYTFARRISISSQKRQNWRAARVLNPFVHNLRYIFLLGEIWIKNRNIGFSTDGWTNHDIFGCKYDSSFNGWTNSTRLMYVKNEEGYESTIQRDVFDNTWFNDDEWIDNNEKAKIKTWGYNEATNILLTYFSLSSRFNSDTNYYYKTSYWRMLRENDIVSTSDNIKVMYQAKSGEDRYFNFEGEYYGELFNLKINNEQTNTIVRLNTTVYYPLKNAMYDVYSSDFEWPEKETHIKLGKLLIDTGFKKHSEFEWEMNNTNGGDSALASFFIEEKFVREQLNWNNINNTTAHEYASSTWYYNDTLQRFDLLKTCTDIVVGFYVSGTDEKDYKQDDSEFNPDSCYYEKINNQYIRRYTMKQLVDQKNIYLKQGSQFTYITFDNLLPEIQTTCYKYELTSDSKYKLVGNIPCKINCIEGEWFLMCDDGVWELNVNQDTNYIDQMTNGEFWYKYHNNESSVLMEKALLIETNLTEYWTNAYYASKNCRFFLPEYWQTTVNQQKNYFHGNIISVQENNDSVKLTLLPTYIPEVVKTAGQIRYQIKNINSKNSENIDTIAQINHLQLNESASMTSVIDASEPLKQIFQYLKLDAPQWIGINVDNDYTMYTYISNGSTWTDILSSLSSNALTSELFGGWYDMMINVLQSCNYMHYEPTQYYEAQKEHDNIWRKIYTKYPNLIYEKAFTNTDATTSAELLQLAQYAFRDYVQPENNYNISVIDINTLKGYKGQELKIGDGIEVNAAELYDDHRSDIYRSLIQYLYITDIKYDLRKDDNIQLTVNPIKYQDKVIGQLIKLIR